MSHRSSYTTDDNDVNYNDDLDYDNDLGGRS